MTALTDIQILLFRQLSETLLALLGRVRQFFMDLEAEGYVQITPAGRSNISIEITERGRKALADGGQSANVVALERFSAAHDSQ
jgi:hypothetical protein